jgi:4'-phosphopantetheinyl transferase
MHVEVWLGELRDQLAAVAAAVLTPDELGRAMRFLQAEDRLRFVWSHQFLHFAVRHGAGCAVTQAQENCPPVAADAEVRLSLSHSGDYAAVAIARGSEVGIDIEIPRDLPEARALARQHFTPLEQAAAGSLPTFFRIWTRKEAILKATGEGFRREPASFAALEDSLELDGGRWQLFDLPAHSQYVGALAVRGETRKGNWIAAPAMGCPRWILSFEVSSGT